MTILSRTSDPGLDPGSEDPGPRSNFAQRQYCGIDNCKTDGFFVYILASRRNGTLYVGVTNDLARRIAEHKAKLVPGLYKKIR